MYSVMLPVVKRLFTQSRITDKYLDTAIVLNWITEDEKEEILKASI